MRILSLNLWGGRLFEALVPYLAAVDADVLCLQEVQQALGVEEDWVIYRDLGAELPQRANLFRELCEALPAHQAFFCPAARGDVFVDDRRVLSDWGLATFVRRSIPVIGQAQAFVHGAFSSDGWGLHPRSRNAHAVRLFDYGANQPLTITHMHGLRDLAGKGDTEARSRQADALIALVRQVAGEGDRQIVCGDFNVLPGSETLRKLEGLGLTELVTTRGFDDTRTSYYKKAPRFADYMLVSANVPVRSFDVVKGPEVSDHRALLLETT